MNRISYPKLGSYFEASKEHFGVSHMAMTPFDRLPPRDHYEPTPKALVHPWHLRSIYVPSEQQEDDRIVYGQAVFDPDKSLPVKDREGHPMPHAPGAEGEHSVLNVVRAALGAFGVSVPVEADIIRSHWKPLPIGKKVDIEVHNTIQNEFEDEEGRVRAIGAAVAWLRHYETDEPYRGMAAGDPYCGMILYWSDRRTSKLKQ